MTTTTVEKFEEGKSYRIEHKRKGIWVGKVYEVKYDGRGCLMEIIEGRAHFASDSTAGFPGDCIGVDLDNNFIVGVTEVV